jgi:hypothetical protein
MKHQRRFAPKGGRIESELVAGFVGISIKKELIKTFLKFGTPSLPFYVPILDLKVTLVLAILIYLLLNCGPFCIAPQNHAVKFT